MRPRRCGRRPGGVSYVVRQWHLLGAAVPRRGRGGPTSRSTRLGGHVIGNLPFNSADARHHRSRAHVSDWSTSATGCRASTATGTTVSRTRTSSSTIRRGRKPEERRDGSRPGLLREVVKPDPAEDAEEHAEHRGQKERRGQSSRDLSRGDSEGARHRSRVSRLQCGRPGDEDGVDCGQGDQHDGDDGGRLAHHRPQDAAHRLVEDEHGDEAAHRDRDAEDAQHEPPRPAHGEPHAEQERRRQVGRECDHPRSAPRHPGGVLERRDGALARGADRRHEGRKERHPESERDCQADSRDCERRGARGAEEARPRPVDERRREPTGQQAQAGRAQADERVLAEQHECDEARRAAHRLEQADAARLLGHAPADQDRHARDGQEHEQPAPREEDQLRPGGHERLLAADALPGVQRENRRTVVPVHERLGSGGVGELEVHRVDDRLRPGGRNVRNVGCRHPHETDAVRTKIAHQEGAEGARHRIGGEGGRGGRAHHLVRAVSEFDPVADVQPEHLRERRFDDHSSGPDPGPLDQLRPVDSRGGGAATLDLCGGAGVP